MGVERAGFVPKRVVGDGDGARAFDAPGEFVELFNGRSLAVDSGLDLLDVAAEIANFIKGVPGSHLQAKFVMNLGDLHGNVKEVLFGMSEGDGVGNCGGGRSRKEKECKSAEV